MDNYISISWKRGKAARGKLEVRVEIDGLEAIFALARATIGILRYIAKEKNLDCLIVEYIGLLANAVHEDRDQITATALHREGGDA